MINPIVAIMKNSRPKADCLLSEIRWKLRKAQSCRQPEQAPYNIHGARRPRLLWVRSDGYPINGVRYGVKIKTAIIKVPAREISTPR